MDAMEDWAKQSKAAAEMERLKQAGQESLPRELLGFMLESKKYWMIPILLVMGLLGVLAVLGSSGLAPFIYPLF